MAHEPTKIIACPNCKQSVPWTEESKFRPFCSERCRLLDLGAWTDGSRYIAGDRDFDGSNENEEEER